jgi:hypothetical protein
MPEKFEGGTPPQERKEGEPTKKYQLLHNVAAGEYYVNEWTQEQLDDWENSGYRTQEGHYNEVGLYDTKEELEKAIEDLRGPDVFAVFEDRAAGEVYSSKEDNLTGNWRGSREGHANLVAEFDTQEEADKFVRERKAYYDKLVEERER